MIEYWNPRIERMPIEDLHKMQEERLRYFVRYAYNHSLFYRQRFMEAGVEPDDIKKLSDVTKLPFTSKRDLRNTYPTGMFCLPKNWVVRYHVSSGTTGKPTVVGYTQSDVDMWSESLARGLTSIGLGRGDVIQVSYGYGLFTGGLGLHYGSERIGATVLPTGTGNTERQIELMQDLGSTAIACTPSYFLYINEVAQKMDVSIRDDTKLKAGIFGAEPWSDETRRRIEDSTGIKAYDIYGTSEMSGPLFTECHLQNGIHIWADMFLIEVIDPKTMEQVDDGERGELVVTSLDKWAFPLIRYRIGDITILNNEPCECGRTHPRIMRILGRTDDMIIVRGINVFPSQVESVLMRIPEIGDNYQIIVDRKGPLDVMTVKVEVTESTFSDKIADLMSLSNEVSRQLKSVLNITAEVELVEPGVIPRSEGKARRVIDKRKV
ncbi:phenylacetate--CoA ligase [Methanosarcinales archaeon]|nr:phenylacetate--CoA ligase [Methanophagales archaeon]MCW7069510.1 phenylacetate--CoA ligase [Methanophagales archaeon]RLG35407.1 MAG: phenylacetate--CoA ligase [Methanosarcinales archaeon]